MEIEVKPFYKAYISIAFLLFSRKIVKKTSNKYMHEGHVYNG